MWRRWGALSLLLTLTLVLLAACSGVNSTAAAIGLEPTGPRQETGPDAAVIDALNQTGFNLYRQLSASAAGDENVFISPVSLALALAMTFNGAQEETATAMAEVLHLTGLDLAVVNQSNLALIQQLTEAVQPGAGVELSLANGIWRRQGREFYDSFLAVNEEFYGATAEAADFDDPATLTAINDWVKDRTQGRVPNLLEEIRADSVMFLLNAIYFQGDWAFPFEPDLTREEPFYLAAGTMPVDMMHQNGEFSYYEDDSFSAVRLPYGEGQQLALYALLPGPGTDWAEFEASLTAENWWQWQQDFTTKFGLVALPRFQTEYKANASQALKALGMEIAFDASAANFGALGPIDAGRNLFLGDVLHQTFLRVDEQGSEAAGATSVEVRDESAPIFDFEFKADRPFFVILQDDLTGAILFAGSIMKPEAVAE